MSATTIRSQWTGFLTTSMLIGYLGDVDSRLSNTGVFYSKQTQNIATAPFWLNWTHSSLLFRTRNDSYSNRHHNIKSQRTQNVILFKNITWNAVL